jgi:hypothetical protein
VADKRNVRASRYASRMTDHDDEMDAILELLEGAGLVGV